MPSRTQASCHYAALAEHRLSVALFGVASIAFLSSLGHYSGSERFEPDRLLSYFLVYTTYIRPEEENKTMTINYEQRDAFRLTGISVRTTNAEEASPNGRLPELWGTFFQNPLSSEPGLQNGHLLYALYTDYESDASGEYTVVIGHECVAGKPESVVRLQEVGVAESVVRQNAAGVPESVKNLQVATVPKARYMVFETPKGPFHETVPQAWRDIWTYFGQSSVKRAYTGDFELYDFTKGDPQDMVVRIYIAVLSDS
jgi:predicted transcriptional regulator YdeE